MYSTLVRGAYANVTFSHYLEALSKGLFELFGKLLAIALVNGCPGPHFLTPIVSRILSDIPQEPQLEEVPEECEVECLYQTHSIEQSGIIWRFRFIA